jgi:hypothetical protein
VKTESPSACAAVNCKVCRSGKMLQVPVAPSGVCKASIYATIQSRTCLISHE